MPPTLSSRPRLVLYYQSQHKPDGSPVSLLPLISRPSIVVSHIIIAAIHLNDPPSRDTVHLNDHPPHNSRYDTLWSEVKQVQAAGVKVMGMLGGAARGSFTRLDQDDATFESYYNVLHQLVTERKLDGLDLDIEEPMSLNGVIRLIDRLKSDFGKDFIITLAPVAAALIVEEPIKIYAELFSYETLEVMRGHCISWYNTQFYCGWGDISNPGHYDMIIKRGFPINKVVVGLMSNPKNGPGWVPFESLKWVFQHLLQRYPGFGGVMAWEYFNSLPGDIEAPWEWAEWMTQHVVRGLGSNVPNLPDIARLIQSINVVPAGNLTTTAPAIAEAEEEAPLPEAFDYISDTES